MINYFNFKKINDDTYLITNDFGNYCFLDKKKFDDLVSGKIDDDELLLNRDFIIEDDINEASNRLSLKYRDMKQYLFTSTCLHIFVLTSDCNFRCLYCQARDNAHHKSGLMTKDIAKKAVDIALQSRENVLNFEFQGGEPLINFPCLKYIVEYAEQNKGLHTINYSVVTNTSLLSEEMLFYLKTNNISIATSLDGPKNIQDINRPFINGIGSYDTVCKKINEIKSQEKYVGAIETTTKYNLDYYKETVDEYVNLGFKEIFIRPLSKLGVAIERWEEIGYTPSEFKEYYKKSLDYILQLNKNGTYIKEGHAVMFLQKILNNYSSNYMELRSPCGASIGQIAYYYDGNIFSCDEGRMIYEMGDDAFLLGNVCESSLNDLIHSRKTKSVMISSITESLPNCCNCVYQPYCGVCPVATHGNSKNLFNNHANNYKCELYKAILDVIFEIIGKNDEEVMNIFISWLK